MIEINLLPGAAKRSRGRGTAFSLKAVTAGIASRVRDPYMIAGVVGVALSAAAVGGMHFTQSSSMSSLTTREEEARRDSTRFALVLRERRKVEAKRDSVTSQLAIIRSIDDDRFVWPHVLDEVSRSLPPYTWLKSISQTSSTPTPAAPVVPDGKEKERKDPVPSAEPMRFRIVGNTVDIQALTRFMKLLETSPFVQNVQLARSEMVMLDGKEVTEFQLDAEYERPDRALITTAPVSLSVR
ncbi:MAG: PilN domain-containing protein [Gemmatimonadota bacterium]